MADQEFNFTLLESRSGKLHSLYYGLTSDLDKATTYPEVQDFQGLCGN